MPEDRALRFAGPRRVELVTVEVPSPGAGEVLVRTRFSGISTGTELLVYRGEVDEGMPLDERLGALGGTFRYPVAYGYSCVGVVERSEAGVDAGSLVFAFHPHQERFVLAAGDVVPLPPGIDPRLATLFPLVETALQVVLDAGPVLAEPVVVSGAGVVGTLVGLLLQRAGAAVTVVEPLAWRRRLAASAGLAACPPEDAAGAVRAATGGRGVPLVVEASGAPGALAAALPLLAHEGSVLVASWYGVKPVTLPLGDAFHRRRLAIRSSQVSTVPARLAGRWDVPRRRAVAVRLLAELPLSLLATTEVAFDDAAAAYAALDRRDPGVLHVALRYDGARV